MTIERLDAHDFRCFASANIEAHPETNLIVGPNGSGKTSLLEAVSVLGSGRSFRVRDLTPLVRHGQSEFRVAARVGDPRQIIEARGGPGGLDLRLNTQTLRGTTELAALLPVQALHPEMHGLIEGSPEGRRRFVDWGAFHVKPGYLDIWRRYHRALRQRNAALKAAVLPRNLQPWNEELTRTGHLLDRARREYVDQLSTAFADFGSALTGGSTELCYHRGWSGEGDFDSALESSAGRDQQYRTTHVGPHRADLEIRLQSAPARYLASRGQQKMLAMGLGLSQAQMIATASPRRLVLLVDDPAAEIDGERAQRIAAQLGRVSAQRFVTGLAPEGYPGQFDRLFHVKQGEVRQVI
jgi:DNA replication and repair protein RecF